MARQPAAFPAQLNLRRSTSDPIYQPNHSNDVPASATAGVASAAFRLSRNLREMADEALTRDGQTAAAEALRREREGEGEATFRPGFAKDVEAYNAALRQSRIVERRAAWQTQLAEIETQHPDSPQAFGQAAEAARGGVLARSTGDAALDLALARGIEEDLGSARARVIGREEQRRRQIAAGVFTSTVSVQETALGQAVASAGFDEAGAQRVSQALSGFIGELAKFGPRQAFSVGGVEFAADPTRQDAMSPEALARVIDAAQASARLSWIRNAADQVQGSSAKAAFVGQVRERWASGDPMFAGLTAPQMDQLAAQLEGDVRRAQADESAAMGGAAADARDMLKALEFGGEVDEASLRARAAASGDVGLMAEVDYRLTWGFESHPGGGALPGGAGGVGGAGGGFGGWVNFLLDRLEGPGEVANDNGRGRARYGITEASHPEAWRDGRIDRTEAAAIYKREYWDAIGGDQLDPELAFVAAAGAVIGGVGTARELLAQADGDPEAFLRLEEARFRRLAAQDPAQYGDDLPGWLARQGRIRGALATMRAQRRSMDGYASDPVDFARGNSRRPALASVPEFDPGAVFEGGAGLQEWAVGLRQRLAAMRGLSERDSVPLRILDNAEAAYFKSAIEADPGRIVPLAAAAATALGSDARLFFDELGRAGVAGGDLHLASLAMEPRNANIVRLALDGRAARAEGAGVPDFGDEPSIARVVQDSASAWSAQPGLTPAVLQLAEDMAIADAQRGRLQEPGAYVNSALGATNRGGRRFGGVVRLNGAATVAPAWLEADRLDDALEIAARGWVEASRGPVYDNGEPLPAYVLRQYRLRAMPNGRYQLVNPRTDRPVPARSGHAFEFDIENDRFRALLARRMPDSVLGGR